MEIWPLQENGPFPLKFEHSLNFSTGSEDEEFSRRKAARDPMSHRIIEKRRRDRMNNCLADLSRLIPAAYIKKGRGRIEKTEIIEMAIRHLKHLQAHPCHDSGKCEVLQLQEADRRRQYRLGYQACMAESVRYLAEVQRSAEAVCLRLFDHLQRHFESLLGGLNCPPVHNDLCFSTSEDLKSDPVEAGPQQFRQVNHPFQPSSGFVEEEGKILRDHPPNSVEKQRRSPSPIIIDDGGGNSNPPPATKRHCPEGGSQLREMLQNPGIPKETRARSNSFSIGCGNYTTKNTEVSNSESTVHMSRTKIEEVYKFKNNIKHRFNADLQHHQTSSPPTPTPNHAECTSGGSSSSEEIVHAERPAHDQRSVEHFQRDVKIPPENRPGKQETWEAHHEYSCGSNPSPTLGANRSNGSSTSSGYSTGGEGPAISKLRFHLQGQQSPVPPQSTTPENLSTPSSSPQQVVPITAVPIFALHPKGTYYIPLTIDMALLNPYFHGYDDPFPILHPVNISVNFTLGRPIKILDRSNVGGVWPGHAFSIEKLGCVFVDRNVPPPQQPHPYPNGTPAAIR